MAPSALAWWHLHVDLALRGIGHHLPELLGAASKAWSFDTGEESRSTCVDWAGAWPTNVGEHQGDGHGQVAADLIGASLSKSASRFVRGR